jgi:O-antigen ligase
VIVGGTRVRLGGLDALLLLALVVVTWQKLAWNVLGRVSLADVVESLFVAALVASRLARRDRRLPPAAVAAAGFGLVFLVVFLAGFGNMDTDAEVAQWTKGLTKWLIHFAFLLAGVAHLVRRGPGLLVPALAAFVGGLVVNAGYAILQLGAQAGAGLNLDRLLLEPFFPGAATSGANLYGRVAGVTSQGVQSSTSVYRGTGLLEDPNHLGVMLCVPVCVLLALALGARDGVLARRRRELAALTTALVLVLLLTQSRSGLLGLAAGLLVLAVPFRRQLLSPAVLAPVVVVGALLAVAALDRRAYVEQVVRSRLETNANGTNTHLAVYRMIPDAIEEHPALGLGLNTFSVLYEFETGRPGFGPHSFFVSVLTETGLLGAAVHAAFIAWIGSRARRLLLAPDAHGGAVRALGWGLLAALAATLAGNTFYLTMTFAYWYTFALLVVAAAAVLARAPAGALARARPPRLAAATQTAGGGG